MAQATPESQAKSKEIHSSILTAGLSQLDSDLIADCVMHDKCMSWMNNDEPKAGAVDFANSELLKDNLNLKIECSFHSRSGKYIWEVKRRQ